MAKFLALILLSIICFLAQTTNAATFKCADESAVCKEKFGAQFEKDFKDVHLIGIRNFLTTYVDIAKAIKAKLSADDPYVKLIDETVDGVNKVLQKLSDNVDNDEKVAKCFKEAMNAMSWDVEDVPENEHLKKLLEEHNFRDALVDVMKKLANKTGNLWEEMYSGLREKDLKTYPEYAEVNTHMENLRGNGIRGPSSIDYQMAAEVLAEKFNLNYFKVNSFIS